MHFPTAISLIAAFGAVSTLAYPAEQQYGPWTANGLPPLPDNLAPGVHHVTYDKTDGTMHMKRVADLQTDVAPMSEATVSTLDKRVNNWLGCESYSFTQEQRAQVSQAWAGLLNWASANDDGASPWVKGHYFALTSSGAFAYLCEWGNGNHATIQEVNQAQGALSPGCNNGPGIYQWNEWKKGLGVAATGQKWCNGVSP